MSTVTRPPLSAVKAALTAGRRMNQSRLAKRLGMSEAMLSRLLSGERNYGPHLDRIAELLGVPVELITPHVHPSGEQETHQRSQAHHHPRVVTGEEASEVRAKRAAAHRGGTDGHRSRDSRGNPPRPHEAPIRAAVEAPRRPGAAADREVLSATGLDS